MQRCKKILIFEFHQETNTFNPIPAGLDSFHPKCIFEGEDCFLERVKTGGVLQGACDAIIRSGGEVIPTVFMHAASGGRVEDAVYDHLCDRLKHYMETVGEFDGVVACLHGATCTESREDACGDLLAYLRKLIGTKPIAAAFDLHANVTGQVLKNADIICGYNTYPHIDQYTTGFRAASLCMKRLSGEKPQTAVVKIPMLIPPAGYHDQEGPFRALLEQGKKFVSQGDILDFTVFPVQPWLDIRNISSCVVTIGEDPKKACACADALAAALFAMRDDAQPPMLPVEEILDIAEANETGKPVILAEPADSPNGGCVGDSPIVPLMLQKRRGLRACVFIVDPEAVKHAFSLGVGAKGSFSIGAKFTPGMPGPFCGEGTVRSLHDGFFHTAKYAVTALGLSAVVSFGSIDILLCSRCGSSGSPMIFRQFGMEPAHYDLVVVKANTSFRLPYSTISDLIYVADTFGAGASNLKQLHWQNLPKALYPFDLPSSYALAKAVIV